MSDFKYVPDCDELPGNDIHWNDTLTTEDNLGENYITLETLYQLFKQRMKEELEE